MEPDAKLMLQVKEGDGDSFELLLAKHRRPVLNYLYRMVRNQAAAEELAQDVFLRVYRARGSYQPTAKFTTWLFRIANNAALNALRDGRRERNHLSLSEDDEARPRWDPAEPRANREEQLLAEARLNRVRDAVARLPEKQRAAVLMHKYEEMDYARIAAVLGCSSSAVKSLLFRAYETLRERLGDLAQSRKDRPR